MERLGTATPVHREVVVAGLPMLLRPESVRVQAQGAAVVAMRLELDVPEGPPGDDKGPVEALTRAKARVAELDITLGALQAERQLAARLAPGFDPEGSLPTAERMAGWLAIEGALEPWIERVDTEIRAARRDLAGAHAAVAALEEQVSGSTEEGAWRDWQPTRRLILSTDSNRKTELTLTYQVPGCTWSAAYVLDVHASLQQGRFAMRALVSQQTGESWDEVALALTTTPCQREVDTPHLPPLRIGTHLPPRPPAWRELPAGFDALFPDEVASMLQETEPDVVVDDVSVTNGSSGWSDDIQLGDQEQEAHEVLAEIESWGSISLDDDAQSVEPTVALPMPQEAETTAPQPPARMAGPAGVMGVGTAVGDDAVMLPPVPLTQELDLDPVTIPAPETSPKQVAVRGLTPSERDAPAGAAQLEVDPDLLDFSRLRLRSFDTPRGVRGRLMPVDDEGLLAEAELPEAARERFLSAWRQAHKDADVVAQRPLPRHHKRPGPVAERHLRFDAQGTVDVPSDGRAHSVAVFGESVELQLQYHAIPRSDPRAFRRVRAQLPEETALPSGPVDVFLDGTLQRTTPWGGSEGTETMELGLGAQEGIQLTRTVRYREETAGIIGGGRCMHTTIDVRVASRLPEPITVHLVERVPVPVDPQAGPAVVITTSTPIVKPYRPPGDSQGLQGAKVQLVEVEAEGEARAVLGYAVTLGANEELVGGDERA